MHSILYKMCIIRYATKINYTIVLYSFLIQNILNFIKYGIHLEIC